MADRQRIFDAAGDTWEAQLEFVLATMRDMSDARDPRTALETFGKHVGQLIERDRTMVISRRDVPPEHYIITRFSEWENPADPWSERHKLPMLKGGILGELIYCNEPRVINDFEASPGDPGYEYLQGMGALMTSPQYQRRESLTTQVLMRKPGKPFDPSILPELVWTANLLGFAVHNARLGEDLQKAQAVIHREMQVISDLQRALLPRALPDIAGLDMAVHYQTAQQAGGDYYDLFPLSDNRVGLLIADVSGHGAPAAVLMAVTHSIARTFPQSPSDPHVFLDYINDRLVEHYTDRSRAFVTAFYGVYDPANRVLTYSSAGHPPPLIKHGRSDRVDALTAMENMPLGVELNATHSIKEHALSPDDFLVMYTDGLTEARDPKGKLFMQEGLDAALRNQWTSPSDLISGVLGAVERFTRRSQPEDDQTLLAARIHE